MKTKRLQEIKKMGNYYNGNLELLTHTIFYLELLHMYSYNIEDFSDLQVSNLLELGYDVYLDIFEANASNMGNVLSELSTIKDIDLITYDDIYNKYCAIYL